MAAAEPGRFLCRLADLPECGASVWLGDGALRRGVIVLPHDGRILAYANACPHRGTPLDMLPGRFLDRGGNHFLCATHGALFRLADGLCVHGPCAGATLSPIATMTRDGDLHLADVAAPGEGI